MRVLYLDCSCGATRAMLSQSLLSLYDNRQELLSHLNTLSLPGVFFSENGIEAEPEEALHHSFYELASNISSLRLPSPVLGLILGVYGKLAEAEGYVHRHPRNQVVFHEVGNREAVASVILCSYLLWKLDPDRIISSPLNVGSGTVRCSHGVLDIPAPCTRYLLDGVPYYQSSVNAELCTPVSAAILRSSVSCFTDDKPEMRSVKEGGWEGMRVYLGRL